MDTVYAGMLKLHLKAFKTFLTPFPYILRSHRHFYVYFVCILGPEFPNLKDINLQGKYSDIPL